jgi:hypothetical protein
MTTSTQAVGTELAITRTFDARQSAAFFRTWRPRTTDGARLPGDRMIRTGDRVIRTGDATIRGGDATIRGGDATIRGGDATIRGGAPPGEFVWKAWPNANEIWNEWTFLKISICERLEWRAAQQ